jgi:hypothetical protein
MKKLIISLYIISLGSFAIGQVKKPSISKDREIQITATKVDGVADLLEFRKPNATEPKFQTKVVNIHAPKEYSTDVALIKNEKNKIKETAEIGIGNDVGTTRRAFNPKILKKLRILRLCDYGHRPQFLRSYWILLVTFLYAIAFLGVFRQQ